MKFAEHLGAHITPEWRKQYIQYEEMKARTFLLKNQNLSQSLISKEVLASFKIKAMLLAAIEEAPSPEVVEPEVRERYFANFDEKFLTFCEKGKNYY